MFLIGDLGMLKQYSSSAGYCTEYMESVVGGVSRWCHRILQEEDRLQSKGNDPFEGISSYQSMSGFS